MNADLWALIPTSWAYILLAAVVLTAALCVWAWAGFEDNDHASQYDEWSRDNAKEHLS